MEKDFETQVLTRLAVIESKIDDYNSIKEKTDTAFNLSRENKEDIDDINDKIKWLSRTIAAAFIAGAIGLIFTLFK